MDASRALVLAGLLLVLVGAPPSASADERPGPTFGIRAAHYGETTTASGGFAYRLAAGSSVGDAVRLFNFTDHPLGLAVYATDVVTAEGGALAPLQRAAARRLGGAWLHLAQSKVTVPARGHRDVAFQVTVPRGVVPGEYPAAVVAEVPLTGSEPGVRVQSRGALLAKIRVSGRADFAVGLGPLRTERGGGSVDFALRVSGAGTVMFTTEARVEIRRGGDLIATVPMKPRGLYVLPDGEQRLTATWDGAPTAGRISAVAVVEATAGSLPTQTLRTHAVSLTFFPLRAVVLTGLLAVLVLASLVLLRHRIRRWVGDRREDRHLVAAARRRRREHRHA